MTSHSHFCRIARGLKTAIQEHFFLAPWYISCRSLLLVPSRVVCLLTTTDVAAAIFSSWVTVCCLFYCADLFQSSVMNINIFPSFLVKLKYQNYSVNPPRNSLSREVRTVLTHASYVRWVNCLLRLFKG